MLFAIQEVQNLCSELSARQNGKAPAAPATAAAAAGRSSSKKDDFWGSGSGGSSFTNRASGSTPSLLSQTGGQATRNQQPTGKGKAKKGKVYQKAAAEDFWGGGTSSGRSAAPAKSTPASSTVATASSTQASVRVPPPGLTGPASKKAQQSRTKDSTIGSGRNSAPTSKLAASGARAQPPAASTAASSAGISKSASKGDGKKPPNSSSASVTAKLAAPMAVAKPSPGWSGVTCHCMGKKHDVVTNCTSCGKIACVMEGGFGCSFCGSALPVTGREPRKPSGGGALGTTGGDQRAVEQSPALKEALARKDKLLLFDRTSASRTRVLDDQGDYFTSHNWLSQKEREKGEAEEKERRDDAALRRGARRQVKVSIDIMGRRVIETQEAGKDGGEGSVESGVDVTGAEGRVSLDFGSPNTRLSDKGTRAGNSAVGGAVTAATNSAGDVPIGKVGGVQRPSLENTGLRGRAKEVYDVMRANLEKRDRRRPPSNQNNTGAAVGKSRVSLWRVQHDVDSDHVLRQSPLGGGGSGMNGLERFEPTDEVSCATR